jgi:hypothetical protein
MYENEVKILAERKRLIREIIIHTKALQQLNESDVLALEYRLAGRSNISLRSELADLEKQIENESFGNY